MDASPAIPDVSDEAEDEDKLISQFVSVGNLSQGPLGAVSTRKGGAESIDFVLSKASGSEMPKKYLRDTSKEKDLQVIQDSSSLFNMSQNDASAQIINSPDGTREKGKSQRNEEVRFNNFVGSRNFNEFKTQRPGREVQFEMEYRPNREAEEGVSPDAD